MNMRTSSCGALLAALLVLASGCESNARPPTVQKEFGPPKQPPAGPPYHPLPIDTGLQAQARAQIQSALHDNNPVIRAHALETVKNLNLPDAGSLILPMFEDPSPLVRKAAALAAGELQLRAAVDPLQSMLNSPDLADEMATVFALHRLGDTSHSHVFERTAADTDPHVRGDTALLLGMLGEKSAVPILLQMMGHDKSPDVRLQAAGALWRLGEESSLDDLIGATISAYPDDDMVALLALAEPRDTRVLGNVEAQLTNDYPEVCLVAARASGMLGSDSGYGVALLGARNSDRRQRSLAALALGDIGRSDAQPVLRRLLRDTDPDTRLAAAGALIEIAARPSGM